MRRGRFLGCVWAFRAAGKMAGASQGIGTTVVKAFRKLDYRIVATSRSIKLSDDENILSIAGDIGDPTTALRYFAARLGAQPESAFTKHAISSASTAFLHVKAWLARPAVQRGLEVTALTEESKL